MKAGSFRTVCWSLMCSMVLAGMLLQPVSGQSPESPAPAVKVEKKEKLTGRLPPYFGEVVSQEQRTKIYEIQTKYGEQLKKLREQIEELDQKQDAEVLAVLSPEQREHVAKKTADAKAKRSKKEPPAAAAAPASAPAPANTTADASGS